ncbi:MAG: glycoside hydrolase family 2, partial [Muribaculaceae bacterium]|nr:glycoside hydrolase family 2 [Muribaculaceae bacterium]
NLYQGWYGGRLDEFEKYLSRQHRDHPSHRLLVSEYGAGSDRRLHSLRPEAFDFSIEYQQDYLEHYLPVIEDSTFVAGASHWNFIDFSSAKRAESMPHINNKGLVTNSRTPKDVYYYYSAMWHDPAKDTVAHIAVNDWRLRCDVPDAKGKVVRPIKVYTNLPEVWLTVNGINYGNKEVVNCNSIFDVELKDGVNLILLQDAAGNVLDSNTIEMSIFDVTDGKLNPGTKELAINVGSNCYFHADDSGLIWLPDTEYNNESLYGHIGGKAVVTQDEIALTSYQPLLQRAMNGLSEYKIKLLPGRYEVELLFAEQGKPSEASAYMLGRNAGTASDKSIMDILINGEIAEKGFSPSDASGAKTMVKRRYFADVTSDGLSIGFNGVSSLAGIKVRKL